MGDDDALKQQYFNKISALLYEASSLLLSTPEPTAATAALWRKNSVLLEVGHGITPGGRLDPGAVGINPKNEYDPDGIAASQPNG